jgi:Trk K+ transport system NAD-binding subunit
VRPDKKVSFAGESRDTVEQSLEIVARVLEQQQPPATRSNVLKILRHENPRARILASDTTVSIGTLTFFFAKNGRLERVTSGK